MGPTPIWPPHKQPSRTNSPLDIQPQQTNGPLDIQPRQTNSPLDKQPPQTNGPLDKQPPQTNGPHRQMAHPPNFDASTTQFFQVYFCLFLTWAGNLIIKIFMIYSIFLAQSLGAFIEKLDFEEQIQWILGFLVALAFRDNYKKLLVLKGR